MFGLNSGDGDMPEITSKKGSFKDSILAAMSAGSTSKSQNQGLDKASLLTGEGHDDIEMQADADSTPV